LFYFYFILINCCLVIDPNHHPLQNSNIDQIPNHYLGVPDINHLPNPFGLQNLLVKNTIVSEIPQKNKNVFKPDEKTDDFVKKIIGVDKTNKYPINPMALRIDNNQTNINIDNHNINEIADKLNTNRIETEKDDKYDYLNIGRNKIQEEINNSTAVDKNLNTTYINNSVSINDILRNDNNNIINNNNKILNSNLTFRTKNDNNSTKRTSEEDNEDEDTNEDDFDRDEFSLLNKGSKIKPDEKQEEKTKEDNDDLFLEKSELFINKIPDYSIITNRVQKNKSKFERNPNKSIINIKIQNEKKEYLKKTKSKVENYKKHYLSYPSEDHINKHIREIKNQKESTIKNKEDILENLLNNEEINQEDFFKGVNDIDYFHNMNKDEDMGKDYPYDDEFKLEKELYQMQHNQTLIQQIKNGIKYNLK